MDFVGSSSVFCSACGAPIPAENNFCGACGQAVSRSSGRSVNEEGGNYVKKRGKGTWIALGVWLAFALILLGAGCIPAFMNPAGFEAHFTGVQTIGLARAINDCGDGDSSGNIYEYIFKDLRGVTYKIDDTSVCSSGIVSDGEHINIWYNPNNPRQFITQNDYNFAMLFIVCFSIPLDILIVVLLVMIVRAFGMKISQTFV